MIIEPYEHQGGCAFPQADGTGNLEEWRFGMSLRDYFAAKAMQAYLIAMPTAQESPMACAEWAYQNADAMLKERAK